jgi:sucrose phosphorylase
LFFLANEALRKGGKVGYKNNPDGSQSPYELNINYYSLLSEPGEKLETSVNKFILSQAIMLIMPGIPGIYFHSLFGSENWKEGLPENSENRAINREKIPVDKLREELSASGSRRKLIYSKYSELLECRSKCKAFHPESGFEILNVCPQVFAVIRGTRQDKKLLALFNVSAQTLEVPINSQAVSSPLRSILDNEIIDAKQVKLKPFDFKWLITM